MKWMIKGINQDSVKKIASKLNLDEVLVNVVLNRGIKSVDEIIQFIKPEIKNLHSPYEMKDIDKALSIISESIATGERIAVYGDYDMDGIISTFILYSTLLELGADVVYCIPDRITEGYGMNINKIQQLKDEGCSVILTCDNGIAAIEQIKYAKEIGFKVVVTDHHDIQEILPDADAVVNPKRNDCNYPFKNLCGAAISFKFVQGLYESMGKNKNKAIKYIQYAAMATICDVVDLIDENRVIVKNGLDMINKTDNLGLKHIIKETGLEGKLIKAYHIGFIIGPCFNASGRLDTAILALKLLLSKNENEAADLAHKLVQLNQERQDMTVKGVEDITKDIETSDLKNDKVLVVYKPEIHESIAGIVAGRIREKYNLPTIVLTDGKEMPKGSGRSIAEYNMFEELVKCKKFLENFGGHPMAAGLSLKKENIDLLRIEINNNCNLTDEDIIPKITIDRAVDFKDISFNMLEQLDLLEPFGKANPSPVFGVKGIEILRAYFIGKNKNVLKMFCKEVKSNKTMEAISFDGVERFKEVVIEAYGEEKLNDILNGKVVNIKLDILFAPDVNEYNGEKKLQIVIRDFRLSK